MIFDRRNSALYQNTVEQNIGIYAVRQITAAYSHIAAVRFKG